ncbi:Rz-like lysis system protein LysB [Hafnia paralvei]|uniref:Rz-like lysis system protein LysB n=1 Tax=Hafnia paralvei TaxID=546367 RepID=UPI003C556501
MRWLVGLCIGVLALIVWRLDVATTTVSFQKQQLTRLEQSLADKNGQLTAINLMAQANDRYQVRLQQQVDALSVALTTKDKRIKELINENVELKSWADTPLPADISRLQQRPAIIGAAGYHAYLSDSDALPATRQSAKD